MRCRSSAVSDNLGFACILKRLIDSICLPTTNVPDDLCVAVTTCLQSIAVEWRDFLLRPDKQIACSTSTSLNWLSLDVDYKMQVDVFVMYPGEL